MAKLKLKSRKNTSQWEIIEDDLPIAQNGRKLDYQWSTQKQPDIKLATPNYTTTKTEDRGKPLTVKEKEEFRKHTENLKLQAQQQELAKRKARIQQSVQAQNQPFSTQNLATETQAIGDKLRFFPNALSDSNLGMIDEYLNPFKFVGDMASGLGSVPYNIQQGNYGQAALNLAAPLATGALAGIGANSTKQFVNNLANPLAGMERPNLSKIKNAVNDNLIGLNEGIDDIFGGRPIFETFPITKKQKDNIIKKQNDAFKEGVDFTKEWYYPNNSIEIRPEVKSRILNIEPRIEEIDKSRYLSGIYKDNPLTSAKNILLEENDDIFKALPEYHKNYLVENKGKIEGANFYDKNSITLRNHGLYYRSPKKIRETAAHELAHSAQDLGNLPENRMKNYGFGWGKQTTSYLPEYNYYSSNPNTEIGNRFRNAMISPKQIKGDGYDYNTWLSSPNELHSELSAARVGFAKKHNLKPSEMQNLTDEQIKELLHDFGLYKHFNDKTSLKEKIELVKLLPAFTGALGVGAASQIEQKQSGGKINNSDWEIIEDDIPMAQDGIKTKKVEYTDKDKYLKAKKSYDDSLAYYKYYQLQKENEFENKPGFWENYMNLAENVIWKPINYLSNFIAPEKMKEEKDKLSKWSENNFDFLRELDIARSKGDITLAKNIIHKYGYDDKPTRKEFWEKNFTSPYKKDRLDNIKEIWNSSSFDKTPYKNFEDFKQKQENLWNYGDSLITANPDFRWSNSGNSPDISHRTIDPTGQWRGLAGNYSMMIPPSVEPVFVEPKQSLINKPITSKPIIKPKPQEKTTPLDTLKVPQYTKIVDGKRVPITEEEYNKRAKGQEAKPTGKVIKQDGRVIKVEAFGGNLILEKYQDGGLNWEILPEAQGGKQMGIISDPRKDAYYTQPANSNESIQRDIYKNANAKQKQVIELQPVEITARRTKPLGFAGQSLKSQQTNPANIPASEVASQIFSFIPEAFHTPSRAVNYALGADNPYQSEISETLGWQSNDPTDLWAFSRNFFVDNAADILVPAEGLGNVSSKSLQQTGKYLTTQTPLKDTYKINPWAFKPNPEAYYHRSPNLKNIINQEKGTLQGFGESEAGKKFSEDVFNKKNKFGEVDIINLKKAANNQLYFSKGVPLDYGRYNPLKKGMSGQGYKGDYLVEVENVPMGASVKGRKALLDPPKNIEGYAVSHRPILIDEAKFYKEDWLRGYKPIKIKQSGGKINNTDWEII